MYFDNDSISDISEGNLLKKLRAADEVHWTK